MAWHHQPKYAARYPIEAAVVHVADHLANAFQFGSSGERLVPPLLAEGWDGLGLSPNVIPSVLRQIELQFTDAVAAVLGAGN